MNNQFYLLITPDPAYYKSIKFQLFINGTFIKEDFLNNLTLSFGSKGHVIKSPDSIIIYKWNTLFKKWINYSN